MTVRSCAAVSLSFRRCCGPWAVALFQSTASSSALWCLVNTPLNFVNPPTRTCRQCMAVRPEATVHINTLCLSLVIISLHFIANRTEFSDLQKWQDCIGSAFRFFSNLSALALRWKPAGCRAQFHWIDHVERTNLRRRTNWQDNISDTERSSRTVLKLET